MSGRISIRFVDFAPFSSALDCVLLRFGEVVSGAKLVRLAKFVLTASSGQTPAQMLAGPVRQGQRSRQSRIMIIGLEQGDGPTGEPR